jgi:wobble nucleotide-excising tRNase
MEKIDILKFRRELQNMALHTENYSQKDVQDVLYRAIEIIDELRCGENTIEAIKYDFNEKLLDEAKLKIMEEESKEKYSILDRIRMLETQVYNI